MNTTNTGAPFQVKTPIRCEKCGLMLVSPHKRNPLAAILMSVKEGGCGFYLDYDNAQTIHFFCPFCKWEFDCVGLENDYRVTKDDMP